MPKALEMPRLRQRLRGLLPRLADCGSNVHALTSAPSQETVPLEKIRRDPKFQSRASTPDNWQDVIKQYASRYEAGEELPPVVLFFDGEQYYPADGHLRLAAQEERRHTTTAAWVYPGGPEDAELYAAGANAEHGLRRTNEDNRRAVEMVLQHPDCQDWPNSRIAEWCRVDDHTVKICREAVGFGNPNATIIYTTKTGKTVQRKATTQRARKPATTAERPGASPDTPGRSVGGGADEVSVSEAPSPEATGGVGATVRMPDLSQQVCGAAAITLNTAAVAPESEDRRAFAELWSALHGFKPSRFIAAIGDDQRSREQVEQLIAALRGAADAMETLLNDPSSSVSPLA